MDEKVYFQTITTSDLELDKVCSRYLHLTNRFEIVRRIGICGLLYYLYVSSLRNSSLWVLAYIGVVVAVHFVTWFRLRNGSPWYNEILAKNGGQPNRVVISFLESKVVRVNQRVANTQAIDYRLYSYFAETEHYLFLFSSPEYSLLIDKRQLQGGTKDQLIDFLHSRCPQLKKKLVSETVGMILAGAYVSTLAVFLVLAIVGL